MINLQFLASKKACKDGIEYFKENYPDEISAKELILDLISKNKHRWAHWLITRLLTKETRIKYAIFAAEQVLYIFEDKYPEDDRPRKAIEAAKEYLNNPNAAAYDAAYAAAVNAANAAHAAAHAAVNAAAHAAYAAVNAAVNAYAAYAATYAAADAAYATDAAADAAYAATYAAYAAADAAAHAAAHAADDAAAADATCSCAAHAADAASNKIYVTILNYVLSLIGDKNND
jgi:hypothetical protein